MAGKKTNKTKRTKEAGKKNVLMLIGGLYHPFEQAAAITKAFLEETGRYKVKITEDRKVLGGGLAKYDGVLIYTCGGEPSGDQEDGLVEFVRRGGALVAVHSANAVSGKLEKYVALIGSQFERHPREHRPVRVRLLDPEHQATTRLGDFDIVEELYFLKNVAADVNVLATTGWLGEPIPLMYTRTEGRGRVFYTALGHGEAQFRHAKFQKSLLHGLDWACKVRPRRGPIRCAMLGYGGAFNMGRTHSNFVNDTPGLKAVGACDIDPERLEQAEKDFPYFKTFGSLDEMLEDKAIDLVVNILPHNLHAPTAIQCLRAGKHVVLEKPFCITLREADAMIREANRAGVMLTAFHNRRWDGDYMTIKRIVQEGRIGEVFEIGCGAGGYRRPGEWWRSDKEISGGNMYDWGAHFVDWVLGLIPQKVASVTGFFHKKVWMHVTNEDHTRAIVRFTNGATADICLSSIAAAGRPTWRILGTRGAILDDRSVENGCKVITYENGSLVTSEVKWAETRWCEYYWNVADHLLCGDPLAVTPQQARRVIGVIECAERSSESAQAVSFRGG